MPASDIVRMNITSNGNSIADTIAIVSVTVNGAINRIPSAEIVVMDEDLSLSDGDDFELDSEIAISVGYGTDLQPIFKGLVVRRGIMIDNTPRLRVECRDHAVRMTTGLKNARYAGRKDSVVMSSLIGNYPGLSADVSDSPNTIPELVQKDCTDWAFLLSRAAANGFVGVVDQDRVSVKAPVTTGKAGLQVVWDDSLLSFQGDLASWTLVTSGASGPSGRMRFQGAHVTPGQLVEVGGVGARFNGDVYVSAVSQNIEAGNWFTEADFGI